MQVKIKINLEKLIEVPDDISEERLQAWADYVGKQELEKMLWNTDTNVDVKYIKIISK